MLLKTQIKKMGQQPNKYHVTDDGKVFRINPDGSFTEMGNAEDLNALEQRKQAMARKLQAEYESHSSHAWVWWLVAIIVFVGAFIGAMAFIQNRHDNYKSSSHYVSDQAEQATEQPTPNEVYQTEQPAAAEGDWDFTGADWEDETVTVLEETPTEETYDVIDF